MINRKHFSVRILLLLFLKEKQAYTYPHFVEPLCGRNVRFVESRERVENSIRQPSAIHQNVHNQKGEPANKTDVFHTVHPLTTAAAAVILNHLSHLLTFLCG